MAMTIGERLKQARIKAGMNQSELARLAKLTPSAISQIESGLSKKPDAINLLKIARALGVTPDWLITGKDSPSAGKAIRPDKSSIAISIVEARSAASSRGGGAINSEPLTVSGEIIVPKKWIIDIAGHVSGNMKIIRAWGDSMLPTFNDGDFLLIDMPDAVPELRDGIYVFRIGEEVFVKRLQKLPGGRILAISDNQAYQPFEIEKTDEFHLMARVIAAWKSTML